MNEKSPGTLVALLGPDLDPSLQVRWALRLATARRLAPLLLQPVRSKNNRVVELPLHEPVPADAPEGLVDLVEESLGTNYRLDSLAVAYDEIDVQLNVRVIGKAPTPEELAAEVRTIASDFYHQPVRARMLTEIEITTDEEARANGER